jgi:hypothetical protein
MNTTKGTDVPVLERKKKMKSAEWIKVLESEVEKRFDPKQVDGFENSAPDIKLGILAEMYENEPMDIEIGKELAYDKLATKYTVQGAWN